LKSASSRLELSASEFYSEATQRRKSKPILISTQLR
jgi:hypothetical protein